MTAIPTRARPLDLLAAEWIKLRSSRSTYWVLLAAAGTAFIIGMMICNTDTGQWSSMTADQRAALDPMADSFVGFSIAQLIFAAIGVLTITSEYSSGLIRTTFAAIPARRAVLAAKATVVSAITLVVGFASALASFVTGQAILSRHHLGISLGQPDAMRAIIATTVFLVSATLIGLGLGALIRNSAAALTAVVVLLFLAPSVLHGTDRWVIDFDNALPANAIRRLVSLHPWQHAPSMTQAVLVVIIYPVIALTAAAYTIHRRDA